MVAAKGQSGSYFLYSYDIYIHVPSPQRSAVDSNFHPNTFMQTPSKPAVPDSVVPCRNCGAVDFPVDGTDTAATPPARGPAIQTDSHTPAIISCDASGKAVVDPITIKAGDPDDPMIYWSNDSGAAENWTVTFSNTTPCIGPTSNLSSGGPLNNASLPPPLPAPTPTRQLQKICKAPSDPLTVTVTPATPQNQ